MTNANTIGNTDLLEACAQAGTVQFLAPSSYLGKNYAARAVAELRMRHPGIRVLALDDVYYASNEAIEDFDEIRPLSVPGADSSEPGAISVNCAYSLSTWLYLDHLAEMRQSRRFDLPELLYALDIALVYQTGAKTRAQTLEYAADFAALKPRFADQHSRDTLDAVLCMRMSGDRSPLLNVLCPGEQEYFSMYSANDHPITLRTDEHYVDVGSYDGDTVKKFITAARNHYASIHAFEPDPTNFEALQRNMAGASKQVHLHNLAVADSNQPLSFSAKGTMGSRVEAGGAIQVPGARLDDLLDQATLIKMDVEGFEPQVLRGAAELIGRCRPRMAITCYHHALDLLDIVAVLDQIYPDARLRLRHYSMYFYDTILYVE